VHIYFFLLTYLLTCLVAYIIGSNIAG